MRSILYSYVCGAGASARGRFDVLATRRRRRTLRGLRTSVIGVGIVLLVVAGVEHHYLAWGIGLASGAVMALYVVVRDSPAQYIEAWHSRAHVERMTARALYTLHRTGAAVLHDLPDGDRAGNIDHIVISRGGVFLLESTFLGGDARVVGDSVIVQRRDDESETYTHDRIASTLRGRAVALKADIEAQTGVRLRVHSVVVLWPGLAAEVVQGDAVVFISGEQIASSLRERKPVMSQEMVARIAAGIERARPHARPSWWRRLLPVPMRRIATRLDVASSAPVEASATAAPSRSA